jgi:hypothetical protein
MITTFDYAPVKGLTGLLGPRSQRITSGSRQKPPYTDGSYRSYAILADRVDTFVVVGISGAFGFNLLQRFMSICFHL